jgi:two-component system, OmpR family, response regulator
VRIRGAMPMVVAHSRPVQAVADARILVVDDDDPLRHALVEALQQRGYDVVGAATLEGACEVVDRALPDLAVVDLGLPDGEGSALVRWLRDTHDLPVVILSGRDGFDDLASGYAAGADQYVTKPFSVSELLLRIRALLRRAGRLNPSVVQVRDLVVDEAAHRVTRAGSELAVTPIEFALLLALVRHAGVALTKSQLLLQAWGHDGYDLRLVTKHLSSLRRKLDAHGPPLIVTVQGIGYRLDP